MNLASVFLSDGALAGIMTFLESTFGAYGSLFLIGLLTLVTQWKHIRASAIQKILSLFSFPIFMLSFVPIALLAPFQKFQWKPIGHTVAVSSQSLNE